MAKVTGIGGVFFKSKGDQKALTDWYQKHLGVPIGEYGFAILHWPDDKAEDKDSTTWNLAKNDSEWFSPSESDFMLNYRVDNLDEIIIQLKSEGIEITQGPESHENGKMAEL